MLAGACDDNTSLAFSAEVVRPLFGDAHISCQRVGQPAADEVAGDAAAVEHFMMAAAAAQITRPATAARLLRIDMAARQPALTRRVVDAVIEVAHRRARVADEAVARAVRAVGRYAQIAGTRTARQRPVRAAVQLLQACGARVVVPSGQHCCGLPQLDSGDRPGASRLAKRTIQALEGVRADYVVTAAASCAIAVLHDYAHLLKQEPEWAERARRLAVRTMDLLSFALPFGRQDTGCLEQQCTLNLDRLNAIPAE